MLMAAARWLGQIPGVPTKYGKGSKWVGDYLNRVRGDHDIVAIVKSNDGWDLVPGDLIVESNEEYFLPADGGPRYPADGVPASPNRLYGCPVAIGYRDFGALNQVTGVDVATNKIEKVSHAASDDDRQEFWSFEYEEDGEWRSALSDRNPHSLGRETRRERRFIRESALKEHERPKSPSLWQRLNPFADSEQPQLIKYEDEDEELGTVEKRMVAWPSDLDVAEKDIVSVEELVEPEPIPDGEQTSWWTAWKDKRAWSWLQGSSNALVFEQDPDSKYALERADYAVEEGPDWYHCRQSGHIYDGRGSGAEPDNLEDSNFAIAYSEVPKLLTPVVCRIARNLHSDRIIEEDGETLGGEKTILVKHEDGTIQPVQSGGDHAAIADGGAVTARRGDIVVEERALVMPEDIKKLGGQRYTQDKIETLKEQVRAKEAVPGSQFWDKLPDYGLLILCFILGAMLVGDADVGGTVTDTVPMFLEVYGYV